MILLRARKQNNPEKVFQCELHKVPNKERFGLATWILVWGIYSNACNIMSIKKEYSGLV